MVGKRTTTLLAAGLLIAAACGDDGGGNAFCDLDDEFANADEGDLDEIVERMRDIEPPEEIADAYNEALESFEASAAGNQDEIDVAAFQEALSSLDDYGQENCE